MSGYGRNSRVRAARRRPYVRIVGTRHADPGIRAARLAVAWREGASHRRGARHARHPVLPAAERADRPPGGARLRPGARQAAAGAASPPSAHALAAPEGHEGVGRKDGTVRTPPLDDAAAAASQPRGPGWPGRAARLPAAGADRHRLRRHALVDRAGSAGCPRPPRGGAGAGRAGQGSRHAGRDHRQARRGCGRPGRLRRRPRPDRARPLRRRAVAGRRAHRAPAVARHPGRQGSAARRARRPRPPAPGSRTRSTPWPCTPGGRPTRRPR